MSNSKKEKVKEKLFLSYGRDDDEPFVRRLYDDLVKKGFEVWLDSENMPNRGLTFLKEIRDEIDKSDRFILVVGPKALASDYVRSEWQHALIFAKAVVPVLRIGEYDTIPKELGLMHAPDFRNSKHYKKGFDALLRILYQPVEQLGPLLTSVPVLPLRFVYRNEALKVLEGLVSGDGEQPIVISGAKQSVSLVGMGGLGKSILAAVLARSAKARRHFSDGIVWVEVGENGNLIEAARIILQAFGLPNPNADWNQVRVSLPAAINNRSCLIVLDDVWHGGDLPIIQGSLGNSSRLLITSRDIKLSEELQAPVVKLDQMAKEESLQLLALWTEKNVKELPSIALDVAHECGHLPLALALCGALVHDGLPWQEILDALKEADPMVLSQVFTVMESSLRWLEKTNPSQAALYKSLAVFPSDQLLPMATIKTLWRSKGIESDRGVYLTLSMLQGKARLQIQGTFPSAFVSLHDLQFDYLHHLAKNRKAELHQELVSAYYHQFHEDWLEVTDDGYFLKQIGYHLVEAGQSVALRKLLLNFEWLYKKLSGTSISELLKDFDRISDDPLLSELRRALYQSAPAVSKDVAQLAGQLIGRLGNSDDKEIIMLLDQAKQWRKVSWLRPVLPNQLASNSPLDLVLTGHEGTVRSVTISEDGRMLASAGNSGPDQTIRIWDLHSGTELHCLPNEACAGGWTPITFTQNSNQLVTCYNNEVRIWDSLKGIRVKSLLEHQDRVIAVLVPSKVNRLVSLDQSGCLLIWNATSWNAESKLQLKKDISKVAISPKGNMLALQLPNAIEVINLETGVLILSEPFNGSSILHFSETTDELFYGSPMKRVNLKTRVKGDIDGAPALDLQVDSRSGLALAINDEKYSVPEVYEFPGFRSLGFLRISRNDQPTDRRPYCFLLAPGGKQVAVCDYQHRVEVWNTGRLEKQVEAHVICATRFRFTDDSKYLWILTDVDSNGLLLNVIDGTEVPENNEATTIKAKLNQQDKIELDAISDKEREDFMGLAINTGGKLIIERPHGKGAEFEEPDHPKGGLGRSVYFQSTKAKRKLSLQGHSLRIRAGVLFSGNTRAATAGYGRVIRIWNLEKGKEHCLFRGHTDIIEDLAISENGRWLLSCGNDRTAKVWDLETQRLVATYTADRPLHHAAVSPDGKWFAVSNDSSGALHLLKLEMDDE